MRSIERLNQLATERAYELARKLHARVFTLTKDQSKREIESALRRAFLEGVNAARDGVL